MSQLNPPGMKSRSQTEDHAGGDRGDERNQEDSPTKRYVVESRQCLWQKRQQKSLGAKKNRQAGNSSYYRKQQAFGQQLAEDTAARCAQRLANSCFASSGTGSGKHEVCYIHAADQQHQAYRAEQQNEGLANIADH